MGKTTFCKYYGGHYLGCTNERHKMFFGLFRKYTCDEMIDFNCNCRLKEKPAKPNPPPPMPYKRGRK